MNGEIKDTFSIGLDIDLEKSQYDENGDLIVEGIASAANEDIQGESIDPKGWDLTYFLRKGFMKWEHSKDPRNFIGEPIEARATRDGLYVRGRLYGGLPKTQEVAELIDGLKKSQSSRRIGMSIEGAALERDPLNPKKVRRAVLRNVALTANPVNDNTWVDLVKSLTGPEALQVELDQTEVLLKQALSRGNIAEELQKSLGTDTPGGKVLMPQSLEQDGDDKDADPKKRRQAIIDAFRKFIQMYLQKTALQKSLNAAPHVGAMSVLTAEGLEEGEADEIASLIDRNHALLKGLAVRVAGGELTVSKVLDELEKSLGSLANLGGGDDIPEEELHAAVDNEENEEDEIDFEPDAESEEADEELGGDLDGDDDGDDEDSELLKSLTSENPDLEEALEVMDVTGFLREITNHVGHSIDGLSDQLQKSLDSQTTVNNELVKSLGAVGRAVLQMNKRAEKAESENAELRASLDEMTDLVKSLSDKVDTLSDMPVGRRGVVNSRDLVPLQKSIGGASAQPQAAQVTRSDIVDLLVKGLAENECDRLDVTRFETSGFQAVSGRGRNYIQRQLARMGN